MREVIKYAVKKSEWDVDILVMSFGFTERTDPETRETEKLLGKADQKRKLMFAAACNDGGNVPGPSFPDTHSRVICVSSANGNGNWSDNPVVKETVKCISALGEDVKAAWRINLSEPQIENRSRQISPSMVGPSVRLSGSSVVAAVAAATAALILEFARQPSMAVLEILDPQKLEDLHTQRGMYRVLGRIWRHDGIKIRRYITPWSLIRADHPKAGGHDGVAMDECLKNLDTHLTRG